MTLTSLQKEIKAAGFKLSLTAVETRSGIRFRATMSMRDAPTRMAFPMIKFGYLFSTKVGAALQASDLLVQWGARV